MKKALVIGGGFAGCAAAHQLSLLGGWDVTLVEAAPFLGGGNKTRFYGGHPYTFGPRHFLTTWEHVFAFLDKYVPMRRCSEHEFRTYVETDHRFYNYPIHADDISTMPESEQIFAELSAINIAAIAALPEAELAKLDRREILKLNGGSQAKNFEEYWIKSIGRTLYDKFVNSYSKKMWMLDDNSVIDDYGWSPKGATIKEGSRAAWDRSISAYPIAWNGYDDYFKISTADAKVLLNTKIERFDISNTSVFMKGSEHKFDIIVNSISPDVLFDYCYGQLKYIGRELIPIVLPVEFALPANVYMVYYSSRERFTRVVEYKKFTLHKAPTTLISLEIPSASNKLYPMPIEAEKSKAKRYFDEMPDTIFNVGRAGKYLYNVDIDDTIDHAFKLAEALRS